MRYRSAAFALKSAHALASPGSTHFPARGVDADALLSPAAVLYLLRFSGGLWAKLCAGSVVGRDGTHLGLCIALKR